MSITTEKAKRYQASDGKTFSTAPAAASYQATIDFTQGVTEVEAIVYKTSDGTPWDSEERAIAHQAALDFDPVLSQYIKEHAVSIFAVQGAEARFRTLVGPFVGWLHSNGVDVTPAMPPEEKQEAAA